MSVYWEDVKEGTEIPPLVKKPTEIQLFLYSAITGISHRIHWDYPFATQHDKLPGILVHGPLQGSFLCQMLTDWALPHGWVRKLSWQNRAMAIPGDTLTCKGRVSRKYVQDGEHLVECEVWVENQRGERTAPGSAVVSLPTRQRS